MDELERDAEREARTAMVAVIAAEVAETHGWLRKDKLDERVMAAMAKVPRHAFVPPSRRAAAYDNRPLPIGHDQTISQPYIVAIMTDLAAAEPGRKVLEVGTGCGYQTAVLAETGARVFSIEVVPALARAAAERLACLGYREVEVRQGALPRHGRYSDRHRGYLLAAVVDPRHSGNPDPGGADCLDCALPGFRTL